MMKYLKLIIIFLASFVLCGCSVKYETTFHGNTVDEKVTFSSLRDSDLVYLNRIKYSFQKYYNITINEENRTATAERREVSIDTFLDNSFIFGYFPLVYNKNKTGDIVAIDASTSRDNLLSYYYVLDDEDNIISIENTDDFNLDINVRMLNKVISNNADKVSLFNVYSWQYDQNTLDKKINIVYNPKDETVDWITLSFGIVALIMVGIIIFIISKKYTKANKI